MMAGSSAYLTVTEMNAKLDAVEARFDRIEEKIDSIDLELQEAKQLAEERHRSLSNQLASLFQLLGLSGSANTPPPPLSTPATVALTTSSVTDQTREPTTPTPKKDLPAVRDKSMLSSAVVNQDTVLLMIDFQIFDQEDEQTWFSMVERFFSLANYSDDERIALISLGLSGKILSSYNWEISRAPFTDGMDFRSKFLLQFGQSKRALTVDRSYNLLRHDAMEDNVEEFQRLAAPMKDLSETHQIAIVKKDLQANPILDEKFRTCSITASPTLSRCHQRSSLCLKTCQVPKCDVSLVLVYDFTIQYKPDIENKAPEGLSGSMIPRSRTCFVVKLAEQITPLRDEVHDNIKYGGWSSTPTGNKKCNVPYHRAFENSQDFAVLKNFEEYLKQKNFIVCVIYLLDSQFITDATIFLSGCMSCLSAMNQFELPHFNILSKMDLLQAKSNINEYLKQEPRTLLTMASFGEEISEFTNLPAGTKTLEEQKMGVQGLKRKKIQLVWSVAAQDADISLQNEISALHLQFVYSMASTHSSVGDTTNVWSGIETVPAHRKVLLSPFHMVLCNTTLLSPNTCYLVIQFPASKLVGKLVRNAGVVDMPWFVYTRQKKKQRLREIEALENEGDDKLKLRIEDIKNTDR